jgi:phosphoglycerate dehydrogenase-like enzyme
MGGVLRWGRSAYERDADLALEAAEARALGLDWALVEDRASRPAGLADADVLVVNSKVRVDERVLAGFRGRLVLTTTSGFDHVDVHACARRGVQVARCPLARRDAVVEHAVGALINLARRLPELDDAAGEGRWRRGDLPALDPRGLAGARVVVVGLGVIGARVATVLGALGATVLGVDPYRPDRATSTLDDALPGADAVTLHCSLTPTSRGLLDAQRLARLPAHAVVVNTARGDVLDLDAALAAVGAGRLRGLAADVFPVEPYPRLADGAAPGVLFTPHASGYTAGLGARIAAEVGATLRAHVDGRPPPNAVSAA